MRITKITIGRLYNLGNYEHVRYELTAEIAEGESAATAVTGLAKILNGIRPLKGVKTEREITLAREHIETLKSLNEEDWLREHRYSVGTREEVIARYQQSLDEDIERRAKSIARQKQAQKFFDDLGGAAEWKDAKHDWSEDYFGED